MSKFWCTDDPVFGECGSIIRGGMFQHQRDLWNAKEFIKALVGGYGAGKTNICAKRAISLCLHNAPYPIMIVSPNYLQAKGTIIPTIKTLLDGRNIKYKFNKSDFEFLIFRNGRIGTIWIRSGDKPDSLKGPNLAAALIDEPFIQDYEVFDQMQKRVREPKASFKEIVLTGTPEQLNWGYDICEGDRKDEFDIKVIHAPTYANKALGEQVVSNMFAGADDKLIEAMREGKFVNMSKGAIYYAFNRSKHVINDFSFNDTATNKEEVFIGMDFNVNPMSFIAFVKREDVLIFFQEFALPNSDTQEACDIIKKLFGDRCKKIFPDPACRQRRTSATAGKTDKSIIEFNGFEVIARAGHPTKRDRYNATNSRLSKEKILIYKGCKNLIKSFEQMSHELLTKQEALTHMPDAATYAVEYIYPIGKIIQASKTWLA